jgi:2-keto-4-pentenoate hydratase
MSVEAIAAQDERLAALHESGRRLVGYKTALLASSAQTRLGAAGPVWGLLSDDMALADGATFDLGTVTSAKAEVELVFELGDDLVGPGLTITDVLAATRALRVGIELPAVRRGAQTPTDVHAFLAHNTLAAGYVLGDRITAFDHLELAELAAAIWVDGQIAGAGVGARVLGNPARSVAWLGNGFARRGRELQADWLVFSGSLTDPISLRPGQSVRAEIVGVGAAEVRTA